MRYGAAAIEISRLPTEAVRMSEPSSCCAASVQASCCEPSAKESCCGTSSAAAGETASCGCAAGASAKTAAAATADGDDPLPEAAPVGATDDGDSELPVAVIGAGPVGLAAAAHLIDLGIRPLLFEEGATVGASIREWGHVRVFSPWEFNIDPVAGWMLEQAGWTPPDADGYPTGDELVERYLEPLAALPEIARALQLGARATGIARHGLDKLKDAGREEAPFELVVEQDGVERRVLARAVIDASGTWTKPNPLGSGGLPAAGERALGHRIAYAIPDVLGRDRERYAGRRVLVVGSGHSAFNAILDLVALRESEPATEVLWAIRGGAAAAETTGCRRAARSAPPCTGSSTTAASSSSPASTRAASRPSTAASCSPTASASSSRTR
jgi:thioredoxin reductase